MTFEVTGNVDKETIDKVKQFLKKNVDLNQFEEAVHQLVYEKACYDLPIEQLPSYKQIMKKLKREIIK